MSTTRKRKGERPDGYIQVTATIGFTPDGKRLRKSFFGKTRAQAEAKRDQYMTAHNAGLHPRAQTMTVSEWVEIWKDAYDIDTEQYGNTGLI